MRTFFLFVLLNYILRNPLLALLIVGVIFYFVEARRSGRYFNPGKFLSKKSTIHELRKRTDVNPHDVDAHNDLGRLLLEEGRSDEAIAHLRTAIERMDESPETNYYLGLALLNGKDPEEGVGYVKRSIELNPRFLYGEPHVALSRHFLATECPDLAVETAKAAVDLNTSSVEGWYLLGNAYAQTGEQEDAARSYAQAQEAFTHLPKYLRLPNRKWRKLAKKASKA